MAIRKTRSDCRVGTFEKKHGLPPGTIPPFATATAETQAPTKKSEPFAEITTKTRKDD